MEIIIGRQGTQKTPINDPSVSRRHCKVTDNGDGTYTVENLSASGTKVDGVEIVRAAAKPDSRIQLGQSYSAVLKDLIAGPAPRQQAQQKTPQPQQSQEPKTFKISHLRRVWEDFNQTNLEMADAQRKTNLIRTGLGVFTMCAMPTIFFFGPVGYVLTGIGVLGNIYSFAGMRNAETAAQRQQRQDAFDDAWVCPNPECRHSINAKNYKMLVRNYKSCPYCKCKYVEK